MMHLRRRRRGIGRTRAASSSKRIPESSSSSTTTTEHAAVKAQRITRSSRTTTATAAASAKAPPARPSRIPASRRAKKPQNHKPLTRRKKRPKATKRTCPAVVSDESNTDEHHPGNKEEEAYMTSSASTSSSSSEESGERNRTTRRSGKTNTRRIATAAAKASAGEKRKRQPQRSSRSSSAGIAAAAAGRKRSRRRDQNEEEMTATPELFTRTQTDEAAEYDIYDEHARDVRHEESRRLGFFIVPPDALSYTKADGSIGAIQAPPPPGRQWLEEGDDGAFAASKGLAYANAQHVAISSGFIRAYDAESISCVNERGQGLKRVWTAVIDDLNMLVGSLNHQAFRQIGAFIARNTTMGDAKRSKALGGRLESAGLSSIPVGLVFAGVNVADHPSVFEQMAMALMRQGHCGSEDAPRRWVEASGGMNHGSSTVVFPSGVMTTEATAEAGDAAPSYITCRPFVIRITSSDSAKLSACIRAIVVGFIRKFRTVSQGARRSLRRRLRRQQLLDEAEKDWNEEEHMLRDPYSCLLSWYMEATKENSAQCEACGSLSNSSSENDSAHGDDASGASQSSNGQMEPRCGSRLVVVLEDVERFDAAVLADLVHLLCDGDRWSNLPFVLLFGIATNVFAVHGKLPSSVTDRMRISKFQLPPSLECLDRVVDRMFLSKCLPFEVSERCVRFMLTYFFHNTFSLYSMCDVLRYILCDHLSRTGLSHIMMQVLLDTSSAPNFMRKEEIVRVRLSEQLKTADLVHLMGLPSMKRDAHKPTVKHCLDLLRAASASNDSDGTDNAIGVVQDVIVSRVMELIHYRSRFQLVFSLFYATVSRLLPGSLRNKRDVYLLIRGKAVEDSPELRSVFDTMMALEKFDIRQLLNSWLEIMHSSQQLALEAGISATSSGLKFAAKLESDILDFLEQLSTAEARIQGKRTSLSTNVPSGRHQRNPTKRRHAMLAIAQQCREGLKPISEGIVAWFRDLCRTSLAPFKTLPLHEPVFCDVSQEELQCRFRPAVADAVLKALACSTDMLEGRRIRRAARAITGGSVAAAGSNHNRSVDSDDDDSSKSEITDQSSVCTSRYDGDDDEGESSEGELEQHIDIPVDLDCMTEDLSILFRLYEQFPTKYISLYQWFRGFRQVCRTATMDAQHQFRQQSAAKVGKEADSFLMARFMRGTTTLQMLGFFKKNTRRLDTVTKLLFL